MSDATCRTCPYRMPLTNGSECHHDTPSRRSLEDSSGTWPFILGTDWCSHHPVLALRLKDAHIDALEAELTTLKARRCETCLSLDSCYIGGEVTQLDRWKRMGVGCRHWTAREEASDDGA